MKRYWIYDAGTWKAPPDWKWWERLIPELSWDESGYRTIVLPLLKRQLVVRLWHDPSGGCPECDYTGTRMIRDGLKLVTEPCPFCDDWIDEMMSQCWPDEAK